MLRAFLKHFAKLILRMLLIFLEVKTQWMMMELELSLIGLQITHTLYVESLQMEPLLKKVLLQKKIQLLMVVH